MGTPLVMIAIFAMVLLVTVGPVLKLLGIVTWQWKVILAPIWVVLSATFLWAIGWALFWLVFAGMLAFIAK